MSEEPTSVPSKPRRGRGFHHRPEKYHLLGASHPAGAAATAPPSGDLRPLKRRKLNQGQSESCGGHGSACLTQVALERTGEPVTFDPSPDGIYGATRCIEQAGTGPLQDSGVDPVDLLSALERGIRAMPANADGTPKPTPDGRVSDLWTTADVCNVPDAPPPNIGLRPTAAEDEECLQCPLDPSGCVLLDPSQADFEDHVRACIGVEKVPVGVGIDDTPAFEEWGDTYSPGKAPLSDASGATKSDGHWVGIFAYRTESDGSFSYWIGNSWGDWGTPDGGIWVAGAWLRARCMVAIKWAIRRKTRS